MLSLVKAQCLPCLLAILVVLLCSIWQSLNESLISEFKEPPSSPSPLNQKLAETIQKRPLHSLLHSLLQLSKAIFADAARKHTTMVKCAVSMDDQLLCAIKCCGACSRVLFSSGVCEKPYKAVVPCPVNSSSVAHNHCHLHLDRWCIAACWAGCIVGWISLFDLTFDY